MHRAVRRGARCERADRRAAADRARTSACAAAGLQWVITGYVIVYAGLLCSRRAGSPTRSGAGGCSWPGSGSSRRRRSRAAWRRPPGHWWPRAWPRASGRRCSLPRRSRCSRRAIGRWRSGRRPPRSAAPRGCCSAASSRVRSGGGGSSSSTCRSASRRSHSPRACCAEQRGERAPLAWRGPLLATAGLAALVYALSEHHWWLALAVTVPLAFLARRPPHPAVVGAVLAAAVLTATTSGGAVLATLHLQDDLHLSPLEAGLHLLPLSVGGGHRLGRRRAPERPDRARPRARRRRAPHSHRSPCSPGRSSPGSGSALHRSPRPPSACGTPRSPGRSPGCSARPRRWARRSASPRWSGCPTTGSRSPPAVSAAAAGLARWTPRGVRRRLGSAPR